MKRALTLLCLLLPVGLALAQAPELPMNSRITQVTVYPEWAMVTRQAQVELPLGVSRLVLLGLPAWIDEDSIRAELSGNDAQILSANARQSYLAATTDAELMQFEARLTTVRDQAEDLQVSLKVLEAEREYLAKLLPWKLDKVPLESATRPVDANELQKVNQYLTTAQLDNATKLAAMQRKLRALQPELTAATKTWEESKRRNRLEQKEIIIEVEGRKAGPVTVSVGYLISGASWYPAYDARTDLERDQVLLQVAAIIQQTTGEDWLEAAITLSTSHPYLTRQKPTLEPWALTASGVEQVGSGSWRISSLPVQKYHAIQGKQEEYNRSDEKLQRAYTQMRGNVEQAAEMVRQVEQRGTTVEYVPGGRQMVKSDGLPVRVAIGELTLPTERRYSVAPAVSQSTYVTGHMRHGGAFPLLPGPARIFVAGSFIGKSAMDFVAAGERFELYLGLEERLKVTRELDGRNSSTSFLGNGKRLRVAYRLQAKSFLKSPAELEVRDQIPWSQDERVKVKLNSAAPKPDSSDKGILAWKLPLAAGEEKTILFEFQLDYPAEVTLGAPAMELEKQILRQ